MHFHGTITISVTADTLPDLIAELGTECAHIPHHLDQVADSWTEQDPHRRQALQFQLSGHRSETVATGILSAHTDPREN